ncbi:hypothetical protein Rhopal_005485-T1 [Rhodotorula paludigena]|uniref:Uncharacterized protein n=1 Tax=Rhodotorula paludigena TaxID=86838 RepID=A0AAV5GRC7_9BASI|nr:hypothetical protein Rhopal_005485-T1 [Rhodotorula paludigena]
MPGLLRAAAPRLLRASAAPRRALSTPAFCFDIDGVLKQGEHVLPQAKQVMQILSGNNPLGKKYPFICVTNGGGSLESERCKKLTKELEVEIGEHQIVQSHTVFRSLVPKYADKPVFIVGGNSDRCRRVAEAYGFKHAYIPADLLAWKPAIWPYHKLTEKERSYAKDADFSTISFGAILVMHDSRDWGRDIQLVTDLVRAQDGVFGTLKPANDAAAWAPERQIPVHFSNPDLLWGNEFSQARFGQGALQESIAAVYKLVTGHELQRTTGGKPTRATYDYAASLLAQQYTADSPASINLRPTGPAPSLPGRVYMVGDNPASDIAGANGYGWESILVQTGVFRGSKPEEAEHVPTVVKRDVLEGIKWALEREGEGDAVSHVPPAQETVTHDGPRE